MEKSLFQGFYRDFIYETGIVTFQKIRTIVTFQKIRTKALDLSMLHSSEGGKKDKTDYG